MSKLSNRLTRERRKRGHSKSEFIHFLGISRVTFLNIENDKKVGSFVLDKISKKLDIPKEKLCKMQGGLKR